MFFEIDGHKRPPGCLGGWACTSGPAVGVGLVLNAGGYQGHGVLGGVAVAGGGGLLGVGDSEDTLGAVEIGRGPFSLRLLFFGQLLIHPHQLRHALALGHITD